MEEKDKKTTEEKDQAIVPDENETKIAALEAEKAKLIEEGSNYRLAYLKEKRKNEGPDIEETEEEKTRRIIREELAAGRMTEIDKEKEALIQKTIRENKELKLALSNKGGTHESTTSHSEQDKKVMDTLVTPEQLVAFKARGWTDKDIERYKRNLIKYGGR